MTPDMKKMKVCFLLCFVTVVFGGDVHLQCNKNCTSASLIQKDINFKQPICCFSFLKDDSTLKRGESPQRPEILSSNWYIHEENEKKMIAINITWSIYTADISEDGYLIRAWRSMSDFSWLFWIRTINVDTSEDQNQKTIVNYDQFGLEPYLDLNPGHTYYFTISSLPLPNDEERIEDLRAAKSIYIPECRDNALINKAYICEMINLWEQQLSDQETQLEATTVPATLISTNAAPQGPHHRLLALGIGLAVIVALLAVFIRVYLVFVKKSRPQGKLVKQSKIFAIVSTPSSERTPHIEAADKLCCYLKTTIKMEVNFSLWRQIEIETDDVIRHVERDINEADYILLIVTKNVDNRNNRVTTGSFENQPLLNPTFNPFNIALKLMELHQNPREKFLVVYFDETSLESLEKACSFQLPEHLSNLLHRIAGTGHPKNKSTFVQELECITSNIRRRPTTSNL